ncbi:MAG: hypothetical protein QXF90_01365 [Thermofilaceae archaeon]
MDLTGFIRLAAKRGEKILVTPCDGAVRFLAVKSHWAGRVEASNLPTMITCCLC